MAWRNLVNRKNTREAAELVLVVVIVVVVVVVGAGIGGGHRRRTMDKKVW
jgi:hypothetical protein